MILLQGILLVYHVYITESSRWQARQGLLSIDILTIYLMSLYLLNGTLVPGSLLVERIVRYGYSPIELTQPNRKCFSGQDGHVLVDSLRPLLLSENFIKPYSEEHLLFSVSR